MKLKRGDKFMSRNGEFSVVKSIYRNIVKIQITGKNSRTEVWDINDFNMPSSGFIKIPYPKINRTNISRHLLEYQLNMIGRTSSDIKKYPNWYKEWTITLVEFNFFKSYAIPLLKKTFRCNKNKAIETFEWFIMQFGLKIQRNE